MKYYFVNIVFTFIFSTAILFGAGRDKNIMENESSGYLSILSLSKHTAVPGDTIWFALSILNYSNDSVNFLLPTPLPVIFTIYKDERPVWRSDYGMMFAQIITPFSLAPSDSISLKAFWLGKDNNAKWLPLGKYYIEGCFTATKQCIRDSLWLVD